MYDNSTKISLNQRKQVHSDGSVEYWRDVPGYEGLYRVSDRGRVKSLPRSIRVANRWGGINNITVAAKVLKGKPGKNGYPAVTLYKDGNSFSDYIHRIVLLSFVGRCPNGMQCRHLNGTKTDNNVTNLKWGTPLEDGQDKIKHGTSKHQNYLFGEKSPRAILSNEQAKTIRQLWESGAFKKIKHLAKSIGLEDYYDTVWCIVRGKTYKQA